MRCFLLCVAGFIGLYIVNQRTNNKNTVVAVINIYCKLLTAKCGELILNTWQEQLKIYNYDENASRYSNIHSLGKLVFEYQKAVFVLALLRTLNLLGL